MFWAAFSLPSRPDQTAQQEANWNFSSEQYCCETWSAWSVGRMNYKFINIYPCGQYSVAELLLVAVYPKTQRRAEHPTNI